MLLLLNELPVNIIISEHLGEHLRVECIITPGWADYCCGQLPVIAETKFELWPTVFIVLELTFKFTYALFLRRALLKLHKLFPIRLHRGDAISDCISPK